MRYGIVAIILALSTSYSQAETLRLAHHYKVMGAGPDGSQYKGEVTIDVTSDTTFAIRWDIGGAVYKGFGMRRDDVLAASFFSDKSSGLAMYEVQGDGLEGQWTFRGENGAGTEHLTPVE